MSDLRALMRPGEVYFTTSMARATLMEFIAFLRTTRWEGWRETVWRWLLWLFGSWWWRGTTWEEGYHSVDEEVVVVGVDDGCSLCWHVFRVDDADPVVHADRELVNSFSDWVEHIPYILLSYKCWIIWTTEVQTPITLSLYILIVPHWLTDETHRNSNFSSTFNHLSHSRIQDLTLALPQDKSSGLAEAYSIGHDFLLLANLKV